MEIKYYLLTGVFILTSILNCKAQTSQFYKNEYFISSTDNVRLQVKEIYHKNKLNKHYAPLLMIHGGGPGAITTFDLDTEVRLSFAEELAKKGLHIFLLNIRGWEKSTLPEYDLSDTSLVTGSVEEANEDIQSALNWLTAKLKIKKVNLFGWATGGHWISYAAIQDPSRIKSIICLNSMYGVKGDWNIRQYFQSPRDTTKYNKTAHFRISDKKSLTTSWTNSIPIDDKSKWRNPVIAEALENQACAYGADPNVLKVPGGYREESFYMSLGKRYWNSKDLTVPTLVIRTKYDFWSRKIDFNSFKEDFPGNVPSKFVTINGTHYVFLDNNDKGRKKLIKLIFKFCTKSR